MKKVLLVCPRFYFYHKLIAERLRTKGYDVDLFEERYYGIFYLLLKFLGNKIFTYFSTRRYLKFLHKHSYPYDILFVIKGESFPSIVVEILKSRNPKLYSVLYQWDSMRNFNYLHLIPYFSRTLSFDKVDCERYGLEYFPLFYTEDIGGIRKNFKDIKYDLLFVSTYLPERIDYLRGLISYSERNNLKFYYYLYITRFQHLKLIFSKKVSGLNTHHVPMSKKQLIEMYSKSNVVVDISNARQSGLSMRVIEMIGAGKKILTTNLNFNLCINITDSQYRLLTNVEDIDIDFIMDKEKISVDEHEELLINNWLDYVVNDEGNCI